MVSIIITVYNRQEVVEEAIKSCLSQDFHDYEIVIVNDGSTDCSEEVIAKYLTADNITYHYQNNKGAAAAKNKGVDLAKYPFVVFLDSDDIFPHSSVLSEIFGCEENKSYDFLCFEKILIKKAGATFSQKDKMVTSNAYVNLQAHMLRSPLNYAGKPPYFFKKERFLNSGGFDEQSKWGDAVIFWRRFFKNDINYKVLSGPSYLYDQTDNNSISRNNNIITYLNALKVLKACFYENEKEIRLNVFEKEWQLLIFYYALKSKNKKEILKSASQLAQGKIYLLPKALIYIIKTKVMN